MPKKYVFKVTLANVSKPPVWRKIEVPACLTFDKFACCILAAMGWEFEHLWQFSKAPYESPSISLPNEDDWDTPIDARKKKLYTIFMNVGDKFSFTYDFGDDWHHNIILEQIKDAEDTDCIVVAAKGKCPPEDIGGPYGYKEFLTQVNDPKNPEYESVRDWLGMSDGETWDVNKPNMEPGQKLNVDALMAYIGQGR